MDDQTILAKAREYISLEQDDFFRTQVESLIAEKNMAELNDRFYTDLAFGTGGLRGVIGGGWNRMNSYTVKKATQGLANYIRKNVQDVKKASVVIAYDSRNFSGVFSEKAALTLCANGIKTYLFTGLRPTPELSFAVRQLRATAGIVLTASHNPPEYNGYKAYWNDGGQMLPPHDVGVINEAAAVTGAIAELTKEDALKKGLLVMIDREIDDPFIDMVKAQSLRPHLAKSHGKDLSIVFTPLCGTGGMPVERALRELGIAINFVPEQKNPDGNFPTLKYPNPEEASALKMALDMAKKISADLVMGTDPDADRLGIAAPDKGEFRLITGNELGALLLDYILTARAEQGTMPPQPAFIKTIVTTDLERLIAESHGLLCYDVLTGFKYIGEKIREFEEMKDGPQFLFGNEESYGYLTTPEVRDKDAISAAVMTAEMTLFHKSQGRTLVDQLRVLWKKYGFFKEIGISGVFRGQSGIATMNALMDSLRNNPPATIAGQTVTSLIDYQDSTTISLPEKKKVNNINLPSSNVLQFMLADGTMVTARPSGTEPKIKFYVSCRGKPGESLENATVQVEEKIAAMKADITSIIEKAQ
ncbi:MAG: phospho-sugar mutase [Chitinispirillaceae bacterium]|jgi:phosphoglucomutase|nr:phospho-sugar mutase [Chitinispirillaceae bacterium]